MRAYAMWMCGRFTLRTPAAELVEFFGARAASVPELPRFNVAPTQPVAVVRADSGERELTQMEWGLIPSTAKEKKYRPINAKWETIASKWPFAEPFKRRRCLVVADGFFEWQKVEKQKLPFLFQLADGSPFAFAGVWDRNRRIGDEVETCTILTTAANSLMAPIHDRCPVILSRNDWARWLSQDPPSQAELSKLCAPPASEKMSAMQVSSVVNSWQNDTEECVQPLSGLG